MKIDAKVVWVENDFIALEYKVKDAGILTMEIPITPVTICWEVGDLVKVTVELCSF